MFPQFESERLRFREIVSEDARSIFSWFSNSEVVRHYGQSALSSEKQAEQFVAFFAKSFSEKRGIRWGIELKEEGILIGTIGYNQWSSVHKRAEIGYELHPNYWRMGYGNEAVSEVLAYGFQQMGLERVGAVVFLENEASNTLLTKLGFEKEGVLKNYMIQDGVAHHTYVYGLLKKQFFTN